MHLYQGNSEFQEYFTECYIIMHIVLYRGANNKNP